eukprot:271420_1
MIVSVGLLLIILGACVFFYAHFYPKQNLPIQQEQAEQHIDNNIPPIKENENFDINIAKTLPPSPKINSDAPALTIPKMPNIDQSDTQNEGLYGVDNDHQMETNGKNKVSSVEMIDRAI